MDGCALVSTNAGWNLAIGAFPRATGRFETLRSTDGCREVTGQVQQDRCWLAYGLAQIRSAPVALARARAGEALVHVRPRVVRRRVPPRGATRRVAGDATRGVARDAIDDASHRAARRRGGARVRRVRRGCAARARARAQGALLVVALALGALGVAARHADASGRSSLVAVRRSPWLPLPGRPPWPPALAARRVALARDDRRHARRLLRRGPLPHGRHAGARHPRRGGPPEAAGQTVSMLTLTRAVLSRRDSGCQLRRPSGGRHPTPSGPLRTWRGYC